MSATTYRLRRLTDCPPDFSFNYEDHIVHSRSREFERHVADSGLSIKMGLRGNEYYFVGGERHTVGPGSYLIVNRHQTFDCVFRSPEPVEGICFYLSPEKVADVYTNLVRSPEHLLDTPGPPPLVLPTFMEKVYDLREDCLGAFLGRLSQSLIRQEKTGSIDFEPLFYTLANRLVGAQLELSRRLSRLDSVRAATREELYRRVSLARSYILDHYHADVDLDSLARVAALSKYHLLRTYKQIYGITPYQEVLRRRLEHARQLLAQGCLVEDVAFSLGFSDRRSFTKAFKRRFGVTPTAYRCEE